MRLVVRLRDVADDEAFATVRRIKERIDLDFAPNGSVWVTGAKGPPRVGPQPGTGDTYRIDPALAVAGDQSP